MGVDVATLDVEGPVTAEIFVVTHMDGAILLTGPCGPAPWLVEAVDAGHPMALVERMARANLADLTLLHSTSWRYERDQVVLSFVAVVPEEAAEGTDAVPVTSVELARGDATRAPSAIAWPAVLEHGLRHLAWLAHEDDAVRAALDDDWHAALERYVPAPFQHLGGTDA